ncbi:MAG TPA: hypothetical protein VMT32_10675 [Bryobacteraceae bacterium]|nr:hypothetical protein [Bryobacteraceae bacterium]
MRPVECEFEAEVLAAVLQSRWPERVDASLRAHVAGCAICSDVAAIAGAVDEAREETRAQATIPDSGRVWWVAQMRARREAAKAAGRPITGVQVIALACAMGLLGACFGATSTWFQSALGRMVSSMAGLDMKAWLPAVTALVAGHAALVAGMAAVILLVPAAVWLAVLRE